MPIFNVGASDGAIEAGAATVGTVAGVGGIGAPVELDKEVRAEPHSEDSLPAETPS